MKHIFLRNITVDRAKVAVVHLESNYHSHWGGDFLPHSRRIDFHDVHCRSADVASIIETINNPQAKLPALPALTPLERKHMSKLGLKTHGFVNLAFESARKDEGVLPRAIELGTLLEQDELMKNLTLIQRTSTR